MIRIPKDGIYKGGALKQPFENPYFTNLNFLHGALHMSTDGTALEAEDFFLFGMNGNTYVIDEADVKSLLGDGTGGAVTVIRSLRRPCIRIPMEMRDRRRMSAPM